jgi:hypothetical protein
MSDPNSASSDILSDGPVKGILRPESMMLKIYMPHFQAMHLTTTIACGNDSQFLIELFLKRSRNN